MRVPRRSWLRINPASLTLAVLLPVVLLFLSGAPILDLIELKAYDLRFLSRGPRPPSPAVVMAAIDEKSLDAEGRWPWPRSKIAALVDTLSRHGARVIGFDIAFSEPDENSQVALIDQLARRVDALAIRDRRLAAFISESRRHADNDRALANAIKSSSSAVVLGYFFHMSEATLEYRLEPSEIDRRLKRLAASKYPLIAYQAPDTGALPFIRAYAPESNLDVFSDVAALGTYDLRNTPFSPLYPGIEVHASVIDSILTQSFMARPEWSKLFDLLAIVTLSALVGTALPWLSPLRGLGFATGLFVLYI